MKKWIPKDTLYCYSTIKFKKCGMPYRSNYCRNLVFDHICNDTMTVPKELGSNETMEIPCKWKVYRCRYTGANTLEDSCLYDDCKCCGVREPKDIC